MRQVCIILLVCVLATAVLADNSQRIGELKAKQQQIVLELDRRQAVINEQQAAMEQLRVEYLKAQGAIEELQRQDAEAAKEPPTKEE